MIKKCEVCGKDMKLSASRAKVRYCCSRACSSVRWSARNSGAGNPNYGKRGELHHNWKGGRLKEPTGYIRVYAPDNPMSDHLGYVLEHRLVMSQKIGRPLKWSEIVHHKDENRENNHPDNLELMSRKEHQIYHNAERARRARLGAGTPGPAKGPKN